MYPSKALRFPNPIEIQYSKRGMRPSLSVSGLSIPSANSFSWMKAGMSPSSEPFTLMERQRNQRRWAAKPAHQARSWGSCTAYLCLILMLLKLVNPFFKATHHIGQVNFNQVCGDHFRNKQGELNIEIIFRKGFTRLWT